MAPTNVVEVETTTDGLTVSGSLTVDADAFYLATIVCSRNPPAATPNSVPSGWTLIGSSEASGIHRIDQYWAKGADLTTGTQTWTYTGSNWTGHILHIAEFPAEDGIDQDDPIVQFKDATSGSTPALTISHDDPFERATNITFAAFYRFGTTPPALTSPLISLADSSYSSPNNSATTGYAVGDVDPACTTASGGVAGTAIELRVLAPAGAAAARYYYREFAA